MKEENIISYSLPSRPRRGKSMTNWSRLERLTDRDIEEAVASDPDAAPILDDEWFRHATIVLPERKVPVSIRIDKEVLDWFKMQGGGYQSSNERSAAELF